MASDSIKDQFWLQRIDITRCVRYYALQGSCRSKFQTFSQAILLASSFGTVLGALDIGPRMVGIISGLAVTLFVVVSYTWNHPHKIAAILSASEKCRIVDRQAKIVWHQLENMNDQEALARWDEIQKSLDAATAPVENNGVGFNERLNKLSGEEATKILLNEPPPDTISLAEKEQQ